MAVARKGQNAEYVSKPATLVENYTGAEGKFLDKSLCLWEIATIRPIVEALPEQPTW
jgi:hypothetical protein